MSEEINIPTAYSEEQALLATLLFTNQLVESVRAYLSADDFFALSHRLIYGAMLKLFDAEGSFNPVTIAATLRDAGDLEAAGNYSYVSDFYSGHVRFTQAESLMPYLTRVKEASIQRRVIHLSGQLQTQAADREPVLRMITAAERELEKLRTQATVRRTDSLGDVVQTVLGQIERIQTSGEMPGLKTGFPDLDRIIHGWQPGLLYTLAAASKEGKTTWALQSVLRASNVPLEKRPVVGFLSLEMPKEKIALRLMQLASGITDRLIYTERMTAQDWRILRAGAEEVASMRTRVYDPAKSLLTEASTLIEDTRRDYGRCDLLIVDFLQLLGSDEGDYNQRNEAGKLALMAYSLKRLAVRTSMPVLTLCQLTKEASKRTDRDANDLSGSDGIKQASDVILMLTCKNLAMKDNDAPVVPYEFRVAANRYGRIGRFNLFFSNEIGAFGEVEQ